MATPRTTVKNPYTAIRSASVSSAMGTIITKSVKPLFTSTRGTHRELTLSRKELKKLKVSQRTVRPQVDPNIPRSQKQGNILIFKSPVIQETHIEVINANKFKRVLSKLPSLKDYSKRERTRVTQCMQPIATLPSQVVGDLLRPQGINLTNRQIGAYRRYNFKIENIIRKQNARYAAKYKRTKP